MGQDKDTHHNQKCSKKKACAEVGDKVWAGWKRKIRKRGNGARWSGIVQGAWGRVPKAVCVLIKGNQMLRVEKKISRGCRVAMEDKFGNKQI